MRNLSALSLFLMISSFLVVPGVSAAESSSDIHDFKPVTTIKESSRPVFDLNIFKDNPKEADDFFSKLRTKQKDFEHDQLDKKHKAFQKAREEESPEKRRKILAEYHKDEQERLQKFRSKQQKKMDKHFKKGK